MATPDFVIVGAPKAGTTSLYRYLQQHPNIFLPENKEPRFFCNYPVETFEFGSRYFHADIAVTAEEYLCLFEDAPKGTVRGEASTDYLSCAGAAARIHDWNPSAKILIMLRNPLDRAFSEYGHSMLVKFQTCSFWESLQREKERIKGRYDPIFFHVKRGLYAAAVTEYLERFGPDQVKVIFFEDFSADTARVVSEVMRFIGVSDIELDVSTIHNQGASDKSSIADALKPDQYEWLHAQFEADVCLLSEIVGGVPAEWPFNCNE